MSYHRTQKLRPLPTNRFFVGRQKIFTRRLVCGEFRQVCDKFGVCRVISQNVLSGLVCYCAVDQDNLAGLVRASTNEESSWESREQASFPTWRISTQSQTWTWLVALKNRRVGGKLMSRQILTRFDPDKKSAVLRQKNRLVCGSL